MEARDIIERVGGILFILTIVWCFWKMWKQGWFFIIRKIIKDIDDEPYPKEKQLRDVHSEGVDDGCYLPSVMLEMKRFPILHSVPNNRAKGEIKKFYPLTSYKLRVGEHTVKTETEIINGEKTLWTCLWVSVGEDYFKLIMKVKA